MKTGRLVSSIRFKIEKFISRFSIYRPQRVIIAVIIMGISIFLLGGGVYDLLVQPLAILPFSQGYLFFYPLYLHEQLLNESLGVMVLYTLGALGLYLLYRSTRYVHNSRQFSFFFRISVALFMISFVAVEALLYWKLNFGA